MANKFLCNIALEINIKRPNNLIMQNPNSDN